MDDLGYSLMRIMHQLHEQHEKQEADLLLEGILGCMSPQAQQRSMSSNENISQSENGRQTTEAAGRSSIAIRRKWLSIIPYYQPLRCGTILTAPLLQERIRQGGQGDNNQLDCFVRYKQKLQTQLEPEAESLKSELHKCLVYFSSI
jgi:hypothetical protein